MDKNKVIDIKNRIMKRLTLKIDPHRHREIKMRSISQGMTMAEWVTIAINNRLIEEDKYNE